jgi:hypothetical protein
MLNALVSLNFFDAAHSVSGRGQANPFNNPPREVGEAQAKAGTGLLNTGLVCGGLDSTRPNGAARGYAGLVG